LHDLRRLRPTNISVARHALTRRARKHSKQSAVVVRFSRARKRYERQGILVELGALERAEYECLSDEERRAAARKRAAIYRETADAKYVERFANEIRAVYPNCPPGEAAAIAKHACEKNSGRVGRTPSAKQLDSHMIERAVAAHIRHEHTDYDRLLSEGIDRQEARTQVKDAIHAVIKTWS